MAAETKYLANTGLGSVATANSNLDGTGTIVTLFTAGSTNGSFVKSVTFKAAGNTTEGMLRLYIDTGGGNKRLLGEVKVSAVTQSATDPTFEARLDLDLNLVAGGLISASTQNSETFHTVVEGFDWSYNPSEVRLNSTEYTGKTGLVAISTANSNLDGTGTLGTVLTAGVSGSGWKGCRVYSITVKAMQNTTKGMVRIFVQDTGSTTKLLTEIPVSATTFSVKEKTFELTTHFVDAFSLAPGFKLLASTEKGESFTVIANAEDYTYAS